MKIKTLGEIEAKEAPETADYCLLTEDKKSITLFYRGSDLKSLEYLSTCGGGWFPSMDKEPSKLELYKIKVVRYKVFKMGRISGRRQILAKGLSEKEAQRLVNSYPDSNRSMVCYTKQ